MEQIGPTFKAAIIGLMIVSGAINTIGICTHLCSL